MANLDHVKPDHYNSSNLSTFDVVDDWDLNFYLGNVVKYIQRVEGKDDPLQNIEKAMCYLAKEYKNRDGAIEDIIEEIK